MLSPQASDNYNHNNRNEISKKIAPNFIHLFKSQSVELRRQACINIGKRSHKKEKDSGPHCTAWRVKAGENVCISVVHLDIKGRSSDPPRFTDFFFSYLSTVLYYEYAYPAMILLHIFPLLNNKRKHVAKKGNL